jgi:exopolysaccharide biosynthesis protein
MGRAIGRFAAVALLVVGFAAAQLVEATRPFPGVNLITRYETAPRSMRMHIVQIDLEEPGIAFAVTAPGGTRETIRRTTLDFLVEKHAQLAVNAHFFLPWPSEDRNVWLIGLAASNGNVFSLFEAPVQSYAIVANAPALNIDRSNRAHIVRHGENWNDGLWNVVSGSAQIITDGVKTIPKYKDATHPEGALLPGGPAGYSNRDSWYDRVNARTVIGLSKDNRKLYLFTVDNAGGSRGMTVGEAAEVLIGEFGVYNALNLDGGGSTTLAMEDAATHKGRIVNTPSDPKGRTVGSNLAVFARH